MGTRGMLPLERVLMVEVEALPGAKLARGIQPQLVLAIADSKHWIKEAEGIYLGLPAGWVSSLMVFLRTRQHTVNTTQSQ